jgi:hypothetical protein
MKGKVVYIRPKAVGPFSKPYTSGSYMPGLPFGKLEFINKSSLVTSKLQHTDAPAVLWR